MEARLAEAHFTDRAGCVQTPRAFDLALMPDHIRRFPLPVAKGVMPEQAEIDLAWQQCDCSFTGSQIYFVQRGYDCDAPIKTG